MSLTPGTRLGVYEVTVQIGEGGMGQVYRARDTKLNRDVALKVLPDSFVNDPDRLARFTREAQTLAALNHPNIAHIHGLEESGGLPALVMELVEGEDLSQKLEGLRARGSGLPLDEALPIARQIADALEAAHEQGIVHRDLKPANIKVRADGTVKVLDFGLAKAFAPEGASATADAMNSPTLTAAAFAAGYGGPGTQVGMILGTAAYMAPEQARGKTVDRRADIWAFGIVLYEMLSGRRAFAGDDVSITLASVLKEDVKWDALPTDLPAPLRRLLRRCLEKDPMKRLSAIGDARLDIDEATEPAPPADASTVAAVSSSLVLAAVRRRERRVWIVGAVATLAGLAALAGMWRRRDGAPPAQRIQFAVQTQAEPGSVTSVDVPEISPDGRLLAFVSPPPAGGANVIWIRPLDTLEARTLAGTEGVDRLFWSPDSRSIGYGAGRRIYRIGADGGSPQLLCEMPDFLGAAWTRSGSILVNAAAPPASVRLFTVSEHGGPPVELTLAGEGVAKSPAWPVLLPDGRHFLYLGWSLNFGARALYAGSLDGGDPVRVMQTESMAVYVDPGVLLFTRGGNLFAQSFDAKSFRVSGEPVRLADDVMASRLMGRAAFSASNNGTLVYRTSGGINSLLALTWVDRAGKAAATVGDVQNYYQIRLSPDGRRVATSVGDPGSSQLSVLDLSNGVSSAVTNSQTTVGDQAWSPDGQTVAYESRVEQLLQFFKQSVGSQKPTPLFQSPVNPKYLDDWSSDGKFLLFHAGQPKQLFVVPVDGSGEPRLLLDSTGVDQAHFSPDGKWIAYQIIESGTTQVWVASFPAFDQRRRVSPAGGGQPVWARDGKELFYLTPTGKLMLVNVDRNAAAVIDFKAPVELFQSPLTVPALNVDQYGVSNDGQRFLFIRPPRAASGAKPPITVVVNWEANLPSK